MKYSYTTCHGCLKFHRDFHRQGPAGCSFLFVVGIFSYQSVQFQEPDSDSETEASNSASPTNSDSEPTARGPRAASCSEVDRTGTASRFGLRVGGNLPATRSDDHDMNLPVPMPLVVPVTTSSSTRTARRDASGGEPMMAASPLPVPEVQLEPQASSQLQVEGLGSADVTVKGTAARALLPKPLALPVPFPQAVAKQGSGRNSTATDNLKPRRRHKCSFCPYLAKSRWEVSKAAGAIC